MRVSWRHILAGVGVTALGAALSASGQSVPGCCSVPAGPTLNVAPSLLGGPGTMSGPMLTPPSSQGCCNVPGDVVVGIPGTSIPAPTIGVGASSIATAATGVSVQASATATTLASGVVVSGASASGTSYARGGGFISSGVTPVAESEIAGFEVDGGYETKIVRNEVEVLEEYCEDKETIEMVVRPVQAVCLDDTGTPHPASQVEDGVSVASAYGGEVYRCMAGTHMQVTIGHMVDGAASFASGDSFSCGKGEALWHAKGGELSCRIQAPQRNCNERSLLRKHGPGVKLVDIATPKTICEPATRIRKEIVTEEIKVPRSLPLGNIVLDGGVGGGVF